MADKPTPEELARAQAIARALPPSASKPPPPPSVRAMDVVIPASYYNRLRSGMEELDTALCPDYPGFTRGSINLLTGLPGSGKSTCTLAIANHIARHYGPVLYNSGEQSLYAVRHIMARTGLVPSEGLRLANLKETSAIIDEATRIRAVAVAQDSIQCLGESHAANERAAKLIIEWANRTGVTALLIGQVNKDGEASGRNSIRHLSDAHLEFSKGNGKQEEKSAAIVRRMTISKNRNGACCSLGFKLDGAGIHFVRDESDEARWGWSESKLPPLALGEVAGPSEGLGDFIKRRIIEGGIAVPDDGAPEG